MNVDPRHCSTGDPDNGGNCTTCVEYRRLRQGWCSGRGEFRAVVVRR